MATSPGGRPADDSPFSSSTTDNWVARAGGLPKYIREVAHALVKHGHSESEAISMAVGSMKRWAAGEDGVRPQVQAAAAAALAEWEAKRGKGKMSKREMDDGEFASLVSDFLGEDVAKYDVEKFDPKEARDLRGRWTKTGEGNSVFTHAFGHITIRPGFDKQWTSHAHDDVTGHTEHAVHGTKKDAVAFAEAYAQARSKQGRPPTRNQVRRQQVLNGRPPENPIHPKSQRHAKSVKKRDFSTDERLKLASKGYALPDGSFPIQTEEDLRNAIQAYGRASNKDAVKEHIIQRAKDLNLEDLIPDEWGDDSDVQKNAEFTREFTIIEKNDEKHLVFGWASVGIDKEGNVVIDKQGDVIDSPEEMEKAAYDFVLHSRDGGEMHIRKGVSTMVESMVITVEKADAMGIPRGILPELAWWTGWKVNDEEVWKGIKSGKYPMFSVHGRGVRTVIEEGE